ncbi:condensin complex subunit 2 isoform X2 [Nasonia vitripennis]|uniref:Condensin complex subunit 2 n=1 Tax=Nasonia vitripennis TaxID=7425 RepID=A0A7M7HDQ5_NASVI|nr:condensin complex subunit 2 isoform X2 [Nasonia vitripennis]
MEDPPARDIHELGENDDEAERLARRERNSSSKITWSAESSLNFSKLPNLSSHELHNQIIQCLKLSAENKISEKNAFQLNMIDFLSYSLIKQDDELTNLQMASACLDASGKIYGYRVDKVHSDLLKVVGYGGRGEKRRHDDNNNDENENNQRQRKRRRKNYHIFSSVELLKDHLCPSYADFKFLGWLPDDELEVDQESSNPMDEDENGEFHFNLDDPISDDDGNNNVMDCRDLAESADRLAQTVQDGENIVDFQDIIANNPNSNVNYEYSYMELNHKIDWAGPSHWKVKFNKNANGVCKHAVKKRKKEISLSYSRKLKEEACTRKYITRNRSVMNTSKWSEEKNENPLNETDHDSKRFYDYFLKSGEPKKSLETGLTDEQNDDAIRAQENFDLSKSLDLSKLYDDDIDFDADDNGEHDHTQHLQDNNDVLIPASQEAFMGNNLVTLPSLIPKVFIPYSQKAKKIDMHKINKATEEILQKIEDENENSKPTEFSEVYLQLPKVLSKSNVASLSAGLSFVSLLHVGHKKNLELSSQNNLCDLIINNHKKDR